MPNFQGVWNISTQYQNAGIWPFSPANAPARAVISGGFDQTSVNNVIEYVAIATTGNASDFGDLTTGNTRSQGSFASQVSFFFFGGYVSGNINVIQKAEFFTLGNTTDYGDLSVASQGGYGVSDKTRGVMAIGYDGNTVNTIEYVSMSSAGNSTDFGDRTVSVYEGGSCSSPTRGLFAGGSSTTNVIDYVTIQTTGKLMVDCLVPPEV
jgi:hypothetical protein